MHITRDLVLAIAHYVSGHEEAKYILSIVNLVDENVFPITSGCFYFDNEIVHCYLQALNQFISEFILGIV